MSWGRAGLHAALTIMLCVTALVKEWLGHVVAHALYKLTTCTQPSTLTDTGRDQAAVIDIRSEEYYLSTECSLLARD